jgi:hypothetical protein
MHHRQPPLTFFPIIKTTKKEKESAMVCEELESYTDLLERIARIDATLRIEHDAEKPEYIDTPGNSGVQYYSGESKTKVTLTGKDVKYIVLGVLGIGFLIGRLL